MIFANIAFSFFCSNHILSPYQYFILSPRPLKIRNDTFTRRIISRRETICQLIFQIVRRKDREVHRVRERGRNTERGTVPSLIRVRWKGSRAQYTYTRLEIRQRGSTRDNRRIELIELIDSSGLTNRNRWACDQLLVLLVHLFDETPTADQSGLKVLRSSWKRSVENLRTRGLYTVDRSFRWGTKYVAQLIVPSSQVLPLSEIGQLYGNESEVLGMRWCTRRVTDRWVNSGDYNSKMVKVTRIIEYVRFSLICY